ncbi:MAG: radical SAM protein, partial [Candidatus Syntropharchaeia archaeon]
MEFRVSRKGEKCRNCGFCELYITCPGDCTGCGACVDACPFEARYFEYVKEKRKLIDIFVNGEKIEVPERITVLKALEMHGYSVYSPCKTGGCWSCAVLINGELSPSCITPVREGMDIVTDESEIGKHEPLRIVSGFQGHAVGGVGTPHTVKPRHLIHKCIEVACFAHGCILRCPTCQNWNITYSSVDPPLTPRSAARITSYARREFNVERMAISGGECTLNRKWLVRYIEELRKMNRDEKARFHVDTNGVVLSPDYIDELVDAGMTDIGIDVKGIDLHTFIEITGILEEGYAKKLMDTEWNAVKYVVDRYFGEIFVGIGIPYNPSFISIDEVYRIGERIATLEPKIQVTVLDYR